MNLSDEAKSALINACTCGAMHHVSRPVRDELEQAGLAGAFGWSLTSRSSIERERLLAEAEDKAFGA
jgi:hypothetical protein